MAVDYEKNERVAVFRLNRPEVLNAVNYDVFVELNAAIEDFKHDPDLWVGILTGTGERAFCAGADIRAMEAARNEPSVDKTFPGFTLTHGFDLFKPVITAVNGYCLGAGMELALACDYRIAAPHARFGMPEVTRGLVPQEGGTQRLPRMLPWNIAAQLLLTGKHIDAERALAVNLINEVVPAEELMERAYEVATVMCETAPLALQAIKKAMALGVNMTLEEGLNLESSMGRFIHNTEDFREGNRAFLENRKPNYQAR